MDGGECAGYLKILVYLYICTYIMTYVFQLNILQFTCVIRRTFVPLALVSLILQLAFEFQGANT